MKDINETKTIIKQWKDKVDEEGEYLGNGILKIDSFVNHQIYPDMMNSFATAVLNAFGDQDISRVITIETSGIAPGYAVADALTVPLVFARKKKPITMRNAYSKNAPSHTKGGVVTLYLSSQMLNEGEKVLLVDDFLASGKTIHAMGKIIEEAGCELTGIATLVEKSFEGGRRLLEDEFNVPVFGLLRIAALSENGIAFENGTGMV